MRIVSDDADGDNAASFAPAATGAASNPYLITVMASHTVLNGANLKLQIRASAQSSAYDDGFRLFVFRVVFPARIGSCGGGPRNRNRRVFLRTRALE